LSNKPLDCRVLVPGAQVVEARDAVKVLAAVAEGIVDAGFLRLPEGGGDAAAESRGERIFFIAVGIVAVIFDDRTGQIAKLRDIAVAVELVEVLVLASLTVDELAAAADIDSRNPVIPVCFKDDVSPIIGIAGDLAESVPACPKAVAVVLVAGDPAVVSFANPRRIEFLSS